MNKKRSSELDVAFISDHHHHSNQLLIFFSCSLSSPGSADRTVKFWDLETFELIGSSGPEVSNFVVFASHSDLWSPIDTLSLLNVSWNCFDIVKELTICLSQF